MPPVVTPVLLTTGDLAKRFRVDRDKIEYVLKTRDIAPVGRAGHFRLFDEAGALAIGSALDAIQGRRGTSR